MEEVVHLVVVPEDGKCEGCGQPIGEEIFETEDMVKLCRACWDECIKESEKGEPSEQD